MKLLGTTAALVALLSSAVCTARVVPTIRCLTRQGIDDPVAQQRECIFVNEDRCPPGWSQALTSLCETDVAEGVFEVQMAIFCCRD